MTKSRSHEDAKLASFRADPEYASDYLNAVPEDGDLGDNCLQNALLVERQSERRFNQYVGLNDLRRGVI